jgi:hypothetical protein
VLMLALGLRDPRSSGTQPITPSVHAEPTHCERD